MPLELGALRRTPSRFGDFATPALLLLFLALQPATAYISTGIVSTADKWVGLMGGFCYDYSGSAGVDGPSLKASVWPYVAGTEQVVMLYNQSDDGWGMNSDRVKGWNTCTEAQSHSYKSLEFNQSLEYTLSGNELWDGGYAAPYEFDDGLLLVHAALTSSECRYFVRMEWRFEFTNGGGFFKKQFSCEDFGSLELYLVASGLFVALFVAHTVARRALRRVDSVHTVVSMLTASIMMLLSSVVFNAMHLLAMASNGYGVMLFKWIAEGADALGQLTFFLLLFVLARGWTVTSTVLEGRTAVGLLFCGVLLLYLIFFVWQASYVYDNAPTFSNFDSYPGILLISLRIVACISFIWLCVSSYRKSDHSAKKQFIMRFGAAFTAWMVALPILLAFVLEAPWNYIRWLNSLTYLGMNFVGMAMLQWMIWPSRVRNYLDLSSSAARARMETGSDGYVQPGENTHVSSASSMPYDQL